MKRKTPTAKERVLAVGPRSKCEWIPGWGLYAVAGDAGVGGVGFTPKDAWADAAKRLKERKP